MSTRVRFFLFSQGMVDMRANAQPTTHNPIPIPHHEHQAPRPRSDKRTRPGGAVKEQRLGIPRVRPCVVQIHKRAHEQRFARFTSTQGLHDSSTGVSWTVALYNNVTML
jgi:hypothetical protein